MADDTVASVEPTVSEGKYVELEITGLKTGSTTINVSAEKYGVKAFYGIPVTVTEKRKFKSVSITSNRKSIGMSNAVESNYDAQIEVKVVDQYDAEGFSDYVSSVAVSKAPKNSENTYTFDESTLTFTAFNGTTPAVAGQYTFTAYYNDGTWDKDKSVSTTITVSDAAKWANNTDLAVDYKLQVFDEHGVPVTEVKNTDDLEDKYTAKIAAYKSNSIFLGFVEDGDIGEWDGTEYTVKPTAKTELGAITTGATFSVKKGAKYALFATSGTTQPQAYLCSFATFVTSGQESTFASGTDNAITFINRGEGNSYGSDDTDFAAAGTYTVNAKTEMDGTEKTLTATLKITDALAASKPTVTPSTYKVESFDLDGVKAVLSTNVDLNNNEGVAASVNDLVQSKDPGDKTWNIKGFWVNEDVKDFGPVNYYVSVGSMTFNIAS